MSHGGQKRLSYEMRRWKLYAKYGGVRGAHLGIFIHDREEGDTRNQLPVFGRIEDIVRL